nr:unnamed protein product [Callosobruchus chinensis]
MVLSVTKHLPSTSIFFDTSSQTGILTNKWKIFHRAISLKPDFAMDIVKACVVLQNFVRERDGYKIEGTFTVTGLADT